MKNTKTPNTTPKSKGAKTPATPKSKGATATRKNDKITKVIYSKMQCAVDEIEKYFFTSKSKERFPAVLYAVNYSCARGVVAYVRPASLYDTDKKEVVHYLCINPSFLSRGLEYLLSTLTHELCHVYESEYIHIARGGYHDKQWHDLMISCGLQPRYQNASRTAVDETIIEGGIFTDFVKYFIGKYGDKYFNLATYTPKLDDDGNPAPAPIVPPADDGRPRADNYGKPIKVYNRNKIKYTCCGCGAKVWGKPNLHIFCGDCIVKGEKEKAMFIPDEA